MKKRYVDQLNMYDAVILYSDNNSDDFDDDVPDYATTLTDFKAKVTAIKDTDQIVQKPLGGIADNKNSLKIMVCKEAASIAKAVRAYASRNDQPDLLGEVQYTRSELVKTRDNNLPQILYNIQATATTLITVTPPATNPLAGSKIDTARLTAFDALITQYETASPQPRDAIVGRKTGNQQLVALFQDANQILKDQLDGLAEQVSDSFYQGYLNARIIVESNTQHSRVAGIITDYNTANPIPGVLVVSAPNSYMATSDSTGHYSLDVPNFRLTYTIKFTKAGYLEVQQAGVTVTRGNATTLNLILTAGS